MTKCKTFSFSESCTMMCEVRMIINCLMQLNLSFEDNYIKLEFKYILIRLFPQSTMFTWMPNQYSWLITDNYSTVKCHPTKIKVTQYIYSVYNETASKQVRGHFYQVRCRQV